MSAEDVELAKQSIELFIAGDRDAAWALWSKDCVGVPPRDWPEPGPFRGREELRNVFRSWSVAFGEDWSTHMTIRDMRDLGDGRVLFEIGFKASGVESGIPIDQELATISTVRDGEIVKGEFFMSSDEAREAAGLA
jgi:ketosteroid isomerase-like protein